MRDRAWTAAIFAVSGLTYWSLVSPTTDLLLLLPDVGQWCGELAERPEGPADHAHHPLLHVLAWLVAHALSLGGELTFATAWRAYQLLSVVGGATVVASVFAFANRRCGRRWALFLAALLGSCYGFWIDASAGESWPLAAAACVGLLVAASEDALGERPASFAKLTGLLLLATLLRQDSVLLVAVLPLLLPWRRALAVTAAAGAASLSLYALGYVLMCRSDRTFVMWLLGIADGGAWATGPLHVRAFELLRSLTYSVAAPDLTMYRPDRGPLRSLWPGITALLLAVVALTPARDPGRRRVVRALLAFFAARLAFYAWWYPLEHEFMSATLPYLALLAAAAHPGPGIARWRAGALGLCLVVTLGGSAMSARVVLDRRVARQLDHAVAEGGPGRLYLAAGGRTYFALRVQHPDVEVVLLLERGPVMARLRAARAAGQKVAVVQEMDLARTLGTFDPVHAHLIDEVLRRGRFVDRSGPGGAPRLAIER